MTYYAVVIKGKVLWSLSKPRSKPYYTVDFQVPEGQDMIQPSRFIKQEERILCK